METVRRAAIGACAAGLLLAASACGWGETGSAAELTDVSATLTGVVRSDEGELVEWWFEHGPTTDYGSTTPVIERSIPNPDLGASVLASVGGLEEGTTYHYRLCARGAADGHGICGADQTFTTTTGNDSVTGTGTVAAFLSARYGATVFATSAPGGADPSGEVTAYSGTNPWGFPEQGPVTCLRVEGNRAEIGFLADRSWAGVDDQPMVVFVEDNGPSSDRYSERFEDALVATCPAPTAASFLPGELRGLEVGPGLGSGDFTVHDHL